MATAAAHHIAARTWLVFAYWCDVKVAGWRFVIRSDDGSPACRQLTDNDREEGHSIGVWLTVAEACHAYRGGDVVFTDHHNTDNEGGN